MYKLCDKTGYTHGMEVFGERQNMSYRRHDITHIIVKHFTKKVEIHGLYTCNFSSHNLFDNLTEQNQLLWNSMASENGNAMSYVNKQLKHGDVLIQNKR